MELTDEQVQHLTWWAQQAKASRGISFPDSCSDERVLEEERLAAASRRVAIADRYDPDWIGGIEPFVRRGRNGKPYQNPSVQADSPSKETVDKVLFSAIFNSGPSASVRKVEAYLTGLAHHQPDVVYSGAFSDSALSALFLAKQSILGKLPTVQTRLLDRLELIAAVAFAHLDERPAFALFANGNAAYSLSAEPASTNGARHVSRPPFVHSAHNGQHYVPSKPVKVTSTTAPYAPGRFISPIQPNVTYDAVFGAAVIPGRR